MSKHTKGEWWADKGELGVGPMMQTKIARVSGNSYEEALANARRIALCVNFCDGMSNEELQRGIDAKRLIKT